MRFVVCFFGLVASTLTLLVGGSLLLWETFISSVKDSLPEGTIDSEVTTSLTGISYSNAGLVIVVAGLYGILGSLFVLFRCGKQGGALMLISVLGAAFMNPYALIFMSFQFLMGIVSLFIGPLPITPPEAKKPGDEDDDEEEKPRPKAKAKRTDDEDEDEEKPRPKAKAKVADDDDEEEEKPKPKAKVKAKPKKDEDDD